MKRLFSTYGWLVINFAILVNTQAQRFQEPWNTWTRNPLTIPVSVTATEILADTNTDVHISLSDGAVTQLGHNCDEPTNAPSFLANLKVRREYQLTVWGTNVKSLQLALEYKPHWTPLSRRGRAAQPKVYRLMVDRELSTEGIIYGENTNGTCSAYTNTWTIELTERIPVNWRQEDGSDDASAAPGDGKWMQMGPGKSLDISRTALDWSVSLGRLLDGLSAGRLSLREGRLTREIYSATNLYYMAGSSTVRDQVELITVVPGSPVLRQVKTYQTFVDIVQLSTNATEMRFYFPSQIGAQTNTIGVYTNITGNPFVIWALENPEPSTTNKFNVVERRNGVSSTNELIFDAASTNATWTLKYGKNSEQRVETRGIVMSYSATTTRVETVEIKYASGATAYKARETYELFPWGVELVEVRIDPDNSAGTANDLVTTSTYNTDLGDLPSFGRLHSLTHPDGYWERREYDDLSWAFPGGFGALDHILTPAGDGPANLEEATPYDSTMQQFIYQDYYHDPLNAGVVHQINQYYKGEDSFNLFRYSHHYNYLTGFGDEMTVDGDRVLWTGFGLLVGDVSYEWDESWGFGLDGHEYFRRGRDTPEELSYAQPGTYNTGSRTFTANTNDFWVGPDYRRSTVYTGEVDGQFVSGATEFVEVSEVDGEEIRWDIYAQPPLLYPNRTWRDAQVYQGGSLAQLERSIFTGLDGSNNATFELITKWVYQNDSLGHTTNIMLVDVASGVTRTIYSANYRGPNTYDGDLLLWEINESGEKTTYTYDSLKRRITTTKEGIAASGGFPAQSDIVVSNSFDACGRIVRARTSSGSLAATNSISYDLAGRTASITDSNALTTTLGYELGGRRTITTLPSGATTIRENFLDRRLKSVTGTGVVNEFHNWTHIYEDSYPDIPMFTSRAVFLDEIRLGTTNSARVRYEGTDMASRKVWFSSPDFDGVGQVAEYHGFYSYHRPATLAYVYQRGKSQEFPSLQILYDMDLSTNHLTAPVNNDGWYDDPESSHRLSVTHKRFTKIGGHWFTCSTNVFYRVEGDATPTMQSILKQRLNGFTSGSTLSEVTMWDADTNTSTVTMTVDRTNKRVTEVTDVPNSTLNATNITVNGLPMLQSTPSVAQPLRFGYDALGRQLFVTNSLGFVSSQTYNTVGQVATATDFTGLATTYQYYGNGVNGAGQVSSTSVGGKTTYVSYTARGEMYRTWGDVPYPQERVYNSYGDTTELHTYRSGSGWSGSSWSASPGTADVTTWIYQEHSGLLTNKTDAAGKSVSFTYANGNLLTRTWARGVVLTNNYNELWELVSTDYSDGTPSVAYTNGINLRFNRSGLPEVTVDASGIWWLRYDHANRFIAAVCTNGLMVGITVSNHFDGVFGRDELRVQGSSPALTNHYRYDPGSSRLAVVSNGVYSATYGYLVNSDLLQTTTCKSNSTTKLTTTRGWEFGSRMSAIVNQAGSTVVSSHGYAYDALGRRRQATLEDGSYWSYDYNDRNELTGARRYWSDMFPVAGQHFGYNYDNIGNRQNARSGGDTNGWNLREASYTVNNLNQYTSVVTPGYEDIMGVALGTSAVTVNSGSADRKVEYFHREVGIANSSSPVWQDVTVSSGGVSSNGGFVFPKNSQTLTYDLDGNLTFDGVWTYEWDAENRLRTMIMTNVSGIANSNRLKLEFAYDSGARRVLKVLSKWNGSAFTSPVTNKFVYDGRNLLVELDASHSVLRSYLWGQDLSGTMGKAGGVGGLLLVADHVPATDTYHFVGYDGNGNITVLVNAADQGTSARYEYSAFGELLRSTGPLAARNPFRFSTKYWDEESGLICYGYRLYIPHLGRWINRDPAAEQGGVNLYGFINNSPIYLFDSDGRQPGSLQELVVLGALAFLADNLNTLSSFPFCSSLAFHADGIAVGINGAFDGALLKNIGGSTGLFMVDSFGLGLGSAPNGRGGSLPAQSFGNAVLAGRLAAVAAVGMAAANVLSGTRPSDETSTAGLAYSYLQNARRGNTAYAELDAVLLGAQLGRDMIGDNLVLVTAAFASSLLQGNAASAFSYLPSYNALNAWDMLTEIEPQLGGL